MVRSTVSNDLVLVYPPTKDLYMKGLAEDQIQQLQMMIQARFLSKMDERTLRIYAVPLASLNDFAHSSREGSYDEVNLPLAGFR